MKRSSKDMLKIWRENPIKFVRDNFSVEPDIWQKKVLNNFAKWDSDQVRQSLQACAGPGKSAVLAWCGWNFLSCYGEEGEHPKGAAVSVTWENLKDNLWVELAKWQNKSEYLSKAFTWTQTKIFCNQHPKTWFLSARSYPKTADLETLGKTLSGIHSKFVLFLIDESGDIPVQVGKAAEQAVGETLGRKGFIKIMQAGNPISINGMLYDASKSDNWVITRITGDPDDPDRSPRIDAGWAQEQIDKYGREDAWVMSYILGKFPKSGLNTLLSPDEVEDAMKRGARPEEYAYAQKRLGIDVARFGLDSTVIFPRQGKVAYKPVQMRQATGPEIAARVAAAKAQWGSELELIDDTGGFGATVIDQLRLGGHGCMGINFSSKPSNAKYYNKRAEMWFLMAEWVKRGGCLPRDPELKKELCAPQYSFNNGKLILESKDQIKKRLGMSPDKADALALTFAMPDMPATDEFEYLRKLNGEGRNKCRTDFDPFKMNGL
jgi:hypothetical protein